MIIFKQSDRIYQFLQALRKMGKSIGFVPTMGALHAGHLSLVSQSIMDNDISVCSIFVNPKQFNNSSDLQHYPVTIEQDIELLEAAGCDVLFLPSYTEIYPDDYQQKIYDLGYLETILEGKHRPGHFQGVCAVVEQLLKICSCDTLYLGRKDYQQCMVIKKLCEINETDIQIVFCETKREEDGLAMSSRNMRLNEEQRKRATTLYKSLKHIAKNYTSNEDKTIKEANDMIVAEGFEIDYIEVTDENLNTPNQGNLSSKKIALVAASIGGIRLIDNLSFN